MQASPRFFDSSLRTKNHKNYKPTNLSVYKDKNTWGDSQICIWWSF